MDNNIIKDFLLIESLQISSLIDEYHLFFLKILPSVFILAVLIEFLTNLEPLALFKRAFISILVLVTVSTFYHSRALIYRWMPLTASLSNSNMTIYC